VVDVAAVDQPSSVQVEVSPLNKAARGVEIGNLLSLRQKPEKTL
jgi:hypothetical protein